MVQKHLSFGDAHVVVECASDSLIPKFLRVTLDTFWRARIDLCLHGLVQPQTHLPIFRSVFVYTSSRVVFEALDRRCDGHRGLPHPVLTSESVRHVSFLPKQLADLFVKIMVKTRIPLCAREIRKRCEELACPAEDDEQVDERVDENVDVEDDEQPEQDLHAAEIMLRRFHPYLGHPSKSLMLRLLRDANAPPEMLTAARNFHFPHCDLMARRTGAVRPVQVSRSKGLGHTILIDACHWKRNRDGREAIIVNIIDEASSFHVALVLTESEPSELGKLTTMDYIEAVRMNWIRFARAPAVIRMDSEGAFKSHEFREWCAARGIEVPMAAGEAHWQIGIVENHIRLLKNQLSLMEDELPDASTDELVEHCVAAKVRPLTFDRYSPSQWWFGTQSAREVQEQGLGENRSSFERRLQFQTAAQTAFVRADARKTLRMAQYARSVALRNPTVGQLVRYFRRSKGGVGGGRDRGLGGKMVLLRPARVLAVEQPTEVKSQVAEVVWLAHGGSLTRAAPEHLVDCSSLDTSLFEVANPESALPGASWLRDLRNLRRTEYADLGNPPTESERLDAWQDPDGPFLTISRSSCCTGTSNSRITLSTATCWKS